MNKKIVVSIGVIVVAAIVLMPAALGLIAQRQQHELIAGVEQRFDVNVAEQHYQRGWFRSSARHRVTPVADDATTRGDEFIIESVIMHGPLPLLGDGPSLRPGVATIHSTVFQTDDGQRRRLPGTITTLVGARGDGWLQYRSGAITETLATGRVVNWQGGTARLAFDRDMEKLNVSADLGSLQVRDADQGWLVDAGPWVANGTLAQSSDDFWTGDVALHIANLAPKRDGVPGWQLSDTSLVLAIDESVSAAAGELGSITLRAETESIQVGDWSGSEAAVELALTDFDLDAFGRFVSDAREQALGRGEEAVTIDGPAATALLRSLLEHGGALELAQLLIPTPHGEVNASLRIALSPQQGPEAAIDVWELLDAQFALRLPRALTDPAAAGESGSAQVVRNVLNYGLLKPDGEHYTVAASYGDGVLTINGASLPYPVREAATPAAGAAIEGPVAAQ